MNTPAEHDVMDLKALVRGFSAEVAEYLVERNDFTARVLKAFVAASSPSLVVKDFAQLSYCEPLAGGGHADVNLCFNPGDENGMYETLARLAAAADKLRDDNLVSDDAELIHTLFASDLVGDEIAP